MLIIKVVVIIKFNKIPNVQQDKFLIHKIIIVKQPTVKNFKPITICFVKILI